MDISSKTRRRFLAGMVPVMAFAAGCTGATSQSDDEAAGTAQLPLRSSDGGPLSCGGGSSTRAPEASALEAQILQRTNAARAQQGLPALQADECLSALAFTHSEDVRDDRVMPNDPHTNIDGDGPLERLEKANIAVTAWRENIFYDCRNQNGGPSFEPDAFAQRAMDWWMNSPGHRGNILSTDVAFLGVGVAKGIKDNNGCYWATQVFLGQ